jgi:hypothetical protein
VTQILFGDVEGRGAAGVPSCESRHVRSVA